MTGVSRRVISWTLTAVVVFAVGVLAVDALGGSGTETVAGANTTAGTPSTAAPATAPETTVPPSTAPPTTAPSPTDLPADSGTGHRVVFSVSEQRMWWVDDAEQVVRTARTSGRANTPQTGTFSVYSKTQNATGLDGSKMDWFVRFTKGPQGWAIGFHNIPTMDGAPVQTEAQLGEPLSHGCIRQAEADAQFTWNWLEVGSTVVVVA